MRRLADRLADRHAQLEPVVVDLAELTAAVARCCCLLEADAAGYNPRARRRMVQATGLADALTGRLTDVFSALQQRHGAPADTPATPATALPAGTNPGRFTPRIAAETFTGNGYGLGPST
jgi:hypothetical protein